MNPKRIVIKVRVKIPKLIGTVKAKGITKKLEIYAKELIDGKV